MFLNIISPLRNAILILGCTQCDIYIYVYTYLYNRVYIYIYIVIGYIYIVILPINVHMYVCVKTVITNGQLFDWSF